MMGREVVLLWEKQIWRRKIEIGAKGGVSLDYSGEAWAWWHLLMIEIAFSIYWEVFVRHLRMLIASALYFWLREKEEVLY